MFRTHRRWTALISLTAITVLLAACGASETLTPSEAPASEPATSEAPSSEAPASEGPQSGQITITISGSSFGEDITITAGSSVVFVNNDSFGHTATHGQNGAPEADALFDVPLADGASTEPIVFEAPGVYNVTCKIHPSMNLTITVV